MSLSNIQLCTIDAVDRAAGKFQVTVHSDDGKQLAIFDCTGEMEALKLRTAIREHADQLRRAADYRERKAKPAEQVDPHANGCPDSPGLCECFSPSRQRTGDAG